MRRKQSRNTSGLARVLITTALALGARFGLAHDEQQRPLLSTGQSSRSSFRETVHETYHAGNKVNSSDAASSPFDDTFRALVAETLASWHIPGIAVAVVDGDHTWAEGFGTAVFPDTPVTPDTLFYTASTTKAFVAAALSLMVDSGNFSVADKPLGWTTPLAAILPEDFVVGGSDGNGDSDSDSDDDAAWATRRLTVEDALSHRTGFAAHDLSRSRRYGLAPDSQGRNATVRDVTRSLRYLPLHTSPRTEWRYCNLLYLVLSDVVETLLTSVDDASWQRPWLGDVLHTWLWRPLGMASTFFSLDDARAAPNVLAQGYYYFDSHDGYNNDNKKNGRFVGVPHMPLEEVSGAGAVISSVRDYARWLRCWIDGPAFAAETGTSSASTETDACAGIPFTRAGLGALLAPKMFTSHSSASPAPFDAPMAYASAWQTTSYKGHRFWGHSGGSK